jgi:hypothetical protein
LHLNDALIYIRLHRSRNLATKPGDSLKSRPANVGRSTSSHSCDQSPMACPCPCTLCFSPPSLFLAAVWFDFVGIGLTDPGSHQMLPPYMWIVSR